MSELTKIYVYLLDEGTDTWRPVDAQKLGEGRYLIPQDAPYDDEDEKWEFTPGMIVRCVPTELASGFHLVAVEKLNA